MSQFAQSQSAKKDVRFPWLLLLVSLLLLVLLSACQTVNLPVPEGFAKYTAHGQDMLRAVSPERVVYRVHSVKGEAKADLDFWKTALTTHFKKNGYLIVEQKPITAASLPGVSFVMATTFAGKDYTYALNVFVHKDDIVLIEVSGENAYYDKYRQQVAAAIAATDFAASAVQKN